MLSNSVPGQELPSRGRRRGRGNRRGRNQSQKGNGGIPIKNPYEQGPPVVYPQQIPPQDFVEPTPVVGSEGAPPVYIIDKEGSAGDSLRTDTTLGKRKFMGSDPNSVENAKCIRTLDDDNLGSDGGRGEGEGSQLVEEPTQVQFDYPTSDDTVMHHELAIGPQEEGSQKKSHISQDREDISLSPEQLNEANQEVIHIVGFISSHKFFCTLCQANLNSIQVLQKHVSNYEHLKKVKTSASVDKSNPLWCDVCCVLSNNDTVYQSHVKGKKHVKSSNTKEQMQKVHTRPIGNMLESLLKQEVLMEGDGLSLGVTNSMMKFLSHEGPFIGLCYAQEVGVEGDKAPTYNCTLCHVQSDAGNHQLHFCSSVHRLNVLKKDYPEKFEQVKGNPNDKESRGEYNLRLKQVVEEIEKVEGRRVDLIQRKILAKPAHNANKRDENSKGAAYRENSHGRGAANERGGRGKGTITAKKSARGRAAAAKKGGHDRGRGMVQTSWRDNRHQQSSSTFGQEGYKGRGKGKNSYQPYGIGKRSSSYDSYGPTHGVYGYQDKSGQGEGGSGWGWGQGQDQDWNSDQWRESDGFYQQRPPVYVNMAGDPSHQFMQQPQVMSGPSTSNIFPPNASNYGVNPPPPVSHNPGATYPYGLMPSVPPPPNPKTIMQQMTIEKLRNETGDKTEAFKALASSMIKTEEDAENAFQLSSALTQALLDYRMKSFGTIIPDSPISALLNVLKKSQPPTTS